MKNNMLRGISLLAFLILTAIVSAQKQITIDDIWTNGVYRSKSVPGFRFMNDGKHYTSLKQNYLLKYDLTTGDITDTLVKFNSLPFPEDRKQVDDYTFSDDESQLLLSTSSESIYRRSSKAWTYVYTISANKLTPLDNTGKQMHPTFSPDGKKVGYVLDNNLYFMNLSSGKTSPVTTDGKFNSIINGSCDWVYEEEFSFTQAFEWSPDSKCLAFYRFDETNVPEFTMTNYTGELYPEYETFKYPKVGAENSKVSIYIYDTTNKKSVMVDRTSDPDGYIPRIKWTPDPKQLCIFWMNRHQNHLELLLAAASTGKTKLLYQEDNKYYIDIVDDFKFLKDGSGFIWPSEQDGYNHVYLYGMDGKQIRLLTPGSYDMIKVYGVDEKNNTLYYQAAAKSPMEREVYSVTLDGSIKKLITATPGDNDAQFSTTYDLYVWTHSTINHAPTIGVYDRSGNLVRMLEENTNLRKLQDECKIQPVEFFKFTTSEGVSLNGFQIKPYNFDPTRKYPVFMYLYGGPGSQEVVDGWMGSDYWWFQSLAQQGYIIACVDNRGTGCRGEEFKKMTYLQLGHYETIDQI
jgi:dipeptidyl-peptidase-4